MLCMQTIAKIRRLHFKQQLSQRQIAKQLSLSRTTVAKYLKSELTQPPQYPKRKKHYPKLGPFIDRLTERLLLDEKLPKNKRISATRHYEWLKDQGFTGHYCSVAAFYREFFAQSTDAPKDVFIPQVYQPGEAYQFDWSEEQVSLAGITTKIYIAHFRLCHSRAFFIAAYLNMKSEIFMDAHDRAFTFFGGVTERGIYDNLKTAVQKVYKGKERLLNPLFACMMSHHLIEPTPCSPAAGWEKGQVENQVRVLRQRLFVPILAFDDMESLNAYLQAQCIQLMQKFKHPEQKDLSVWEAFAAEKPLLQPFVPFKGKRVEQVMVNKQSLILLDRHHYSVPAEYVGQSVLVAIGANHITITHNNQILATHQRSYARDQYTYNPWHYLGPLQHKPGALRNGQPFKDWPLPNAIIRLQKKILKQMKGDRAMVRLLTIMAEYSEDVAVTAAEIALEENLITPEALQNIINRLIEPLSPPLTIIAPITQQPLHISCTQYNDLLKGAHHATR